MFEICELFWGWLEGGKEIFIVGRKILNVVVKY